MITTETNSNASTTAFHTTNNNNKLSAFSYHKVQAMISEVMQKTVASNTPQQGISDHLISICANVEARLLRTFPGDSLPIALFLTAFLLFIASIPHLEIMTPPDNLNVNNINEKTISQNNIPLPSMLEFIYDVILFFIIFLGCYLLQRRRHTPDRQIIPYSLQNIHRLAKILNTSNENNPDISMLFQLIQAIQDLSFLSGDSSYDNVHQSLISYLATHQQCFDPLLQHAMEQDQKKLHKMLQDLDKGECLSLIQIEKYYEFLEEATNKPEGSPNTERFKVALAHKLLSDLPSLNEEIINASDEKRRLTGLNEDKITMTIDPPNPTGTEEDEPQETQCHINDLIDKLHYTSRLCSLLDSCYPSLDSTLRPTQDQCAQLTQCDKIYQNLRSQLLALCLNTYEKIPKVWAMSAIARQLNRSWIERYRNQPLPHEHPVNPVNPDNQCPISQLSFDEIAPTVEQSDNIIILDADNHLYNKKSIMNWAKTTNIPLGVVSPLSHRLAHILDVIPLNKIINMKQFTIENLLPETLPLDFIPQKEEAT